MEHRDKSRWEECTAVAGVALVLVVMPLVKDDLSPGSVALDPFVLTLVAVVLMAVPLLRKVGCGGFSPSALLAPGLMFCAWSMLSVLANGADDLGMVMTVGRYLGYLALAILVGFVARDQGSRRVMVWTLVGVALVTVVIAVVQYPALAAYDRALQIAGGMGDYPPRLIRLKATFANANFYAEYLLLALSSAVHLLASESRIGKVCAGLSVLVITIALLLTYTRGAWIGLALGVVLAVVVVNDAKLWIASALCGAAALAVPGVLGRAVSAFSLEGTAGVRLSLWKVAGAAILDHPWFGNGPGDFYEAFKHAVIGNPELNIGAVQYGAHNSFFTLTAETGLVGGLCFGLLVLAVIHGCIHVSGREGLPTHVKFGNAALAMGIAAFAVNAFTSNTFQHPQGAAIFWVVVGLQMGLGADYWHRGVRPLPPEPLSAVRRGWSLIVLHALRIRRSIGLTFRDSVLGRWAWSCPDTTAAVLADSRIMRLLFPDRRSACPVRDTSSRQNAG